MDIDTQREVELENLVGGKSPTPKKNLRPAENSLASNEASPTSSPPSPTEITDFDNEEEKRKYLSLFESGRDIAIHKLQETIIANNHCFQWQVRTKETQEALSKHFEKRAQTSDYPINLLKAKLLISKIWNEEIDEKKNFQALKLQEQTLNQINALHQFLDQLFNHPEVNFWEYFLIKAFLNDQKKGTLIENDLKLTSLVEKSTLEVLNRQCLLFENKLLLAAENYLKEYLTASKKNFTLPLPKIPPFSIKPNEQASKTEEDCAISDYLSILYHYYEKTSSNKAAQNYALMKTWKKETPFSNIQHMPLSIKALITQLYQLNLSEIKLAYQLNNVIRKIVYFIKQATLKIYAFFSELFNQPLQQEKEDEKEKKLNEEKEYVKNQKIKVIKTLVEKIVCHEKSGHTQLYINTLLQLTSEEILTNKLVKIFFPHQLDNVEEKKLSFFSPIYSSEHQKRGLKQAIGYSYNEFYNDFSELKTLLIQNEYHKVTLEELKKNFVFKDETLLIPLIEWALNTLPEDTKEEKQKKQTDLTTLISLKGKLNQQNLKGFILSEKEINLLNTVYKVLQDKNEGVDLKKITKKTYQWLYAVLREENAEANLFHPKSNKVNIGPLEVVALWENLHSLSCYGWPDKWYQDFYIANEIDLAMASDINIIKISREGKEFLTHFKSRCQLNGEALLSIIKEEHDFYEKLTLAKKALYKIKKKHKKMLFLHKLANTHTGKWYREIKNSINTIENETKNIFSKVLKINFKEQILLQMKALFKQEEISEDSYLSLCQNINELTLIEDRLTSQCKPNEANENFGTFQEALIALIIEELTSYQAGESKKIIFSENNITLLLKSFATDDQKDKVLLIYDLLFNKNNILSTNQIQNAEARLFEFFNQNKFLKAKKTKLLSLIGETYLKSRVNLLLFKEEEPLSEKERKNKYSPGSFDSSIIPFLKKYSLAFLEKWCIEKESLFQEINQYLNDLLQTLSSNTLSKEALRNEIAEIKVDYCLASCEFFEFYTQAALSITTSTKSTEIQFKRNNFTLIINDLLPQLFKKGIAFKCVFMFHLFRSLGSESIVLNYLSELIQKSFLHTKNIKRLSFLLDDFKINKIANLTFLNSPSFHSTVNQLITYIDGPVFLECLDFPLVPGEKNAIYWQYHPEQHMLEIQYSLKNTRSGTWENKKAHIKIDNKPSHPDVYFKKHLSSIKLPYPESLKKLALLFPIICVMNHFDLSAHYFDAISKKLIELFIIQEKKNSDELFEDLKTSIKFCNNFYQTVSKKLSHLEHHDSLRKNLHQLKKISSLLSFLIEKEHAENELDFLQALEGTSESSTMMNFVLESMSTFLIFHYRDKTTHFNWLFTNWQKIMLFYVNQNIDLKKLLSHYINVIFERNLFLMDYNLKNERERLFDFFDKSIALYSEIKSLPDGMKTLEYFIEISFEKYIDLLNVCFEKSTTEGFDTQKRILLNSIRSAREKCLLNRNTPPLVYDFFQQATALTEHSLTSFQLLKKAQTSHSLIFAYQAVSPTFINQFFLFCSEPDHFNAFYFYLAPGNLEYFIKSISSFLESTQLTQKKFLEEILFLLEQKRFSVLQGKIDLRKLINYYNLSKELEKILFFHGNPDSGGQEINRETYDHFKTSLSSSELAQFLNQVLLIELIELLISFNSATQFIRFDRLSLIAELIGATYVFQHVPALTVKLKEFKTLLFSYHLEYLKNAFLDPQVKKEEIIKFYQERSFSFTHLTLAERKQIDEVYYAFIDEGIEIKERYTQCIQQLNRFQKILLLPENFHYLTAFKKNLPKLFLDKLIEAIKKYNQKLNENTYQDLLTLIAEYLSDYNLPPSSLIELKKKLAKYASECAHIKSDAEKIYTLIVKFHSEFQHYHFDSLEKFDSFIEDASKLLAQLPYDLNISIGLLVSHIPETQYTPLFNKLSSILFNLQVYFFSLIKTKEHLKLSTFFSSAMLKLKHILHLFSLIDFYLSHSGYEKKYAEQSILFSFSDIFSLAQGELLPIERIQFQYYSFFFYSSLVTHHYQDIFLKIKALYNWFFFLHLSAFFVQPELTLETKQKHQAFFDAYALINQINIGTTLFQKIGELRKAALLSTTQTAQSKSGASFSNTLLSKREQLESELKLQLPSEGIFPAILSLWKIFHSVKSAYPFYLALLLQKNMLLPDLEALFLEAFLPSDKVDPLFYYLDSLLNRLIELVNLSKIDHAASQLLMQSNADQEYDFKSSDDLLLLATIECLVKSLQGEHPELKNGLKKENQQAFFEKCQNIYIIVRNKMSLLSREKESLLLLSPVSSLPLPSPIEEKKGLFGTLSYMIGQISPFSERKQEPSSPSAITRELSRPAVTSLNDSPTKRNLKFQFNEAAREENPNRLSSPSKKN